jgi:pimeloyl-ACP methyl ester carboxylesterase
MPFASNQGTKICYAVEGQGPPILLAHGATGDMSFWRGYGYVDKLKDKYTVILFDARGHGRSDKPHEAENYDYRLMVGDVIAVMDTLGLVKTHYWGYSMGAHTGLGMAKHFPERLLSLVIGATTADADSDDAEPDPLLKMFWRGVQEGHEGVVEDMRALFGSITPQYEQRLRSLDLQAMVALLEYRRTSLENDVLQIKLPCLLYAGEHDVSAHTYLKEVAQQLPNARFHSLAGLNHSDAADAMEEIMPQVLAFLAGLEERRTDA